MNSERSDSVFAHYRVASEKFDYFVTGLTGAICAYITQTYHPEKLSLHPTTLELLSLLLLIGSVVAGFKRIEYSLITYRYNAHLLRLQEQKGQLVSKSRGGMVVNEATGEVIDPVSVHTKIQVITEVLPEFEDGQNKNANISGNWYKARNWLLFLGFMFLVSSKVWSAYV